MMVATLEPARRVSRSKGMALFARFGLAARAFIYLLIGVLAIQIARGDGSHEADQRGALAAVAQHAYGVVVLWVLAIGLAGYALWRLTEAAAGTAAEGDKIGPRLQSAARGVTYAAFSVSTFAFIAGTSRQSQAQQQRTLTSRIMSHEPGRWLIAIVGIIVVVVGVAMVVEGATRKFTRQLQMDHMQASIRRLVVTLGAIGTTARGIVFAVAGGLTIAAAITYDPTKSSGLDGALRTLADRAYGSWLLGFLALGLLTFGIYGFAAARWAKV